MKRSLRSAGWLISAGLVAVLTFAACGGDKDAADSEPSSRGDGSAGQGLTDKQAIRAAGDDDSFAPSDGAQGAGLSGATTGQESAPRSASSQSLLDRKLIRTATISLEADSVSQRFEDISNIAVSSGGLVFSSSFGNDGEEQTASITIRVPNDSYESVLGQLRRLGEVRSEQSNASDVTEEYTDLQSSLTNLQATEREYLKLLAQAQTVDEILLVQDRINGTRAQIDQIQGRLNLLGNQTDLATITAHLTPVVAPPPADDDASSVSEVAQEAFDASIAVLMGILVVAIAVGAFSWWLLPLAALGVYLGRRQMKQDRARNQAPPPAPTT